MKKTQLTSVGGKPGHIAATCVKGSWNRSLNAGEEDKMDISEEKCMKMTMSCMRGVFVGGERE